MAFESSQPENDRRLTDFIERVDATLRLSKGAVYGWFGYINPSKIPIDLVAAQLRQVAEANARPIETFDYPLEVVNTQSWLDLVDKDNGDDASLIILKPEKTEYDDEKQKAHHFAVGLQAYGLQVRNSIHETGHGIVIVAPEGTDALGYAEAVLGNPDMATYAAVNSNLALDQRLPY